MAAWFHRLLHIVRGSREDADLREEIDIDSMDFLNFVIALHETLHLEIPEADYPKLASLNGCLQYVMEMQSRQGKG